MQKPLSGTASAGYATASVNLLVYVGSLEAWHSLLNVLPLTRHM